jgi:hypothetical protein
MAVTINNAGDAKSGFICYAELDHTFQTKDYLIRVTPRGKQWYRNDGSIDVYVDFHNITDGVAGRFDNAEIPPVIPADNNQHRHAVLRTFNVMILNDTPIASPVFP